MFKTYISTPLVYFIYLHLIFEILHFEISSLMNRENFKNQIQIERRCDIMLFSECNFINA